MGTRSGGRVVVGVDGSNGGDDALRWAARYSELLGARLVAVIAWEPTSGFGFMPVAPRALEREARNVLDCSLERVLGRDGAGAVTATVRRGPAAAILLEEASDAALLVVGAPGYEGLAGVLAGSVSEQCVRHCECSVVVVRASS